MILINLFFILLGVYFICTHIKADRMSDRVMICTNFNKLSVNAYNFRFIIKGE